MGSYAVLKRNKLPAVELHTFNPSTQQEQQVDLCEFKANLVCGVSSKRRRRRTRTVKHTNQQ